MPAEMPSVDTWPYFHLSRQLTYEMLPQEESDDLFEVCVIVRPVIIFSASLLFQRFSRRRSWIDFIGADGRWYAIEDRIFRTEHHERNVERREANVQDFGFTAKASDRTDPVQGLWKGG